MKIVLLPLIVVVASACTSLPLYAQYDELLNLSPFVVGPNAGYGPPAVTLRKRADYITLSFDLVNDARRSEDRTTEIYDTVAKILQSSEQNGRIFIQAGRAILSGDNYRVDTVEMKNEMTKASLIALIDMTPGDSADRLTRELIEFVRNIEETGRTIVEMGTPGLTVVNPERYRYELIEAIAADITKIRNLLGPETKVQLDGLEGKLQVRAASAEEVELWLNYDYFFYTGESLQ